MKTKTINLYEFSELSKEAKEHAINKWYENEDYSYLEDVLTESLKSLLKENGCEYNAIQVLYSLSYSQGDGLCFTGNVYKNGVTMRLTHNHRYCFAASVESYFFDETGEETEENKELTNIYLTICREVEKQGYAEIEYRMTEDEFSELCTANEYFFDEKGELD